MASNIARFDLLRAESYINIANGAGAYIPVGYLSSPNVAAPLLHAMRLLDFNNDTNATILVSFDGINDNLAILSGSFRVYDVTSDEDSNESFRYQNGTQIYIRYLGVAPTEDTNLSNNFYLSAMYGKGE